MIPNSKIRHHLNDAILMGYAAGTLPEAFNLMVATHVSLCDECRARVEAFDTVGGEVLENSAVEAVASATFLATMALIDGGPVGGTAERAIRAPGVFPGPLQDYTGGDLSAVRWKRVGMGVKQAVLPTSAEASARLLYIPAGTAMPDHGHRGMEMSMVLQGAFQDEYGYFARGDVEIADSHLQHAPVADIDEDCICLAVTDAPLLFKSLIPKIAQRFIRI